MSTEASVADSTSPVAAEEDHRSRPTSEAFKAFMASNWADRPASTVAPSPAAAFTPARRERLAAQFPSATLVIPAGPLKVRSNDTDYRFRPHSAFAHLTGLGKDQEPDAVLVLHADGRSVLYMRPASGRDTDEFFADARYGEFWVGARPTLADMTTLTGIESVHVDGLRDALAADAAAAKTILVVPGADESIETLVEATLAEHAPSPEVSTGSTSSTHALESEVSGDDAARGERTGSLGQGPGESQGAQRRTDSTSSAPGSEVLTGSTSSTSYDNNALLRATAELRLIKDEYEIEQMQVAVDATVTGFEEVVRALPAAIAHRRGERVVETAFEGVARREGNTVGYDTIAAAGENATTLHWIVNDGPVRDGELLLLDAGVEAESLYTADVTRTLPISGRFTEVQRRVYQAVLDAADAGFAVAKPGAKFIDVHNAAMEVIAARLEEWGLLPDGVTAEISLSDDGQHHRRWMVHGTSHHLGIDVHDCAQARNALYKEGILEPGHVFTIEPGLYFKSDDLAVPEEYRGIGVRIEDDVLITADGCVNLSAALPRDPDAVEAWMTGLR